jgi:hypothetical protein
MRELGHEIAGLFILFVRWKTTEWVESYVGTRWLSFSSASRGAVELEFGSLGN